MKKEIIIISLLSLILLAGLKPASGQGFSLGAKAGASFSYFSNWEDEFGSRSPNIMIDGGFIFNFAFTRLISIQAEVLSEQKGQMYKTEFLDQSQKMRLYLNYLTLPVLVEFSHSFGNFRLFGGIGPYLGYALNGKLVSSGQKGNIRFGIGSFRRFDAGGSADLGTGVTIGPGYIFLDLRYNYGLMDIFQPAGKPHNYKPTDNRDFVISLGYMINLRKK